MGNKSNKKYYAKMTINSTELLLNRANKASTHLAEVRQGCGVQRDKTTYNRKEKHKKDYKSYTDLCIQ